jgi:FtsZ-binding cell division protein ZapB
MSTTCKYCNKSFNTTSALNWHLQKDNPCIQQRNKTAASFGKSYKTGAANKSGPARTQFRDVPVVIDPNLNATASDEKALKKIPTKPPRHNRGSSKTEVDLSNIVGVGSSGASLQFDNPAAAAASNTTGKASQAAATSNTTGKAAAAASNATGKAQLAAATSNTTGKAQLATDEIAHLQHTIETLQEANQKLAYENIALMGENTSLKNKIIKQDDELHLWKDKVLTSKQKLVGEDLKNELIGLMLDSDLNISSIPDEFEREIYGFIVDKLADQRGCFKRLFSCK